MPKNTQLVSVQDSNLILFNCKAQALFSPLSCSYWLLIPTHIQKHKREFNFQLENNWVIEHEENIAY